TVASVTPGTAVPTGTVTFSINGVSQSPVGLNSQGQAILTTSFTTAGAFSVMATYNPGNTNFNGSLNTVQQQVVQRSQTGLTSTPKKPIFGQTVTFTATVKPLVGTGIPTGTVEFFIDGVDRGPVGLNSVGQASFSV